MEPSADHELTGRDRAILAAVTTGTAELGRGGELYLDGLCCCDQAAALRLVQDGLIGPVAGSPAAAARRPATVTLAGRAALGAQLAQPVS